MLGFTTAHFVHASPIGMDQDLHGAGACTQVMAQRCTQMSCAVIPIFYVVVSDGAVCCS